MEPRSAALTFHLQTGSGLLQALQDQKRRPLLQTHVAALDALHGGGLRRGTFVEIHGPSSSGRLAIAWAVLGAATRAGETAALIDLGDQFDPPSAQAAGVDPRYLLWAKPAGQIKTALASAEMLLATDFSLVVLDLIGAEPSVSRVPAAAWLRLARAAGEHKAILVTVSAVPLGSVAADVVIAMEKSQARWRSGEGPALLEGFSARVSVQSRKGEWARRAGTVTFQTLQGIGR